MTEGLDVRTQRSSAVIPTRLHLSPATTAMMTNTAMVAVAAAARRGRCSDPPLPCRTAAVAKIRGTRWGRGTAIGGAHMLIGCRSRRGEVSQAANAMQRTLRMTQPGVRALLPSTGGSAR